MRRVARSTCLTVAGQKVSFARCVAVPGSRHLRAEHTPSNVWAAAIKTSITAGTVMHRSRLSLQSWFLAAYLVARNRGRVSALQLQARVKIAYQTALEVKRKLQLTEILEEDELLQGVVEVDSAEIPFEAYSPVFTG